MAVKASATITLTSYRDTQSVTRYYKLQPAGSSAPLKPETKPPSSDWTDSEPACDISKELYFCDLTIFSNGEGEYSKVSKSTSYEAAKQAYNKAQSAKDSIDNLEVGGRNLLVGSKDGTISNQLLYGSTAVKYNDVTLDGNPLYYMSGPRYIKINFPALKVGEQYTFSCDVARNSGGSSQDVFISIGESTTNVGIAIGGIWTNFNVTFTASNDSTYALVRVNNASSSGSDDYIAHTRHFKLEKGNKATDWTPAPEDVDAGIANVQTGVDSLNDTVFGVQTFNYVLNGVTIPAYKREDGTYYYILNDEEVTVAESALVHDSQGDLTSYQEGGVYEDLEIISGDIEAIDKKVNGFDAREDAIYASIEQNSLIARNYARFNNQSLIITNESETKKVEDLKSYLQLKTNSINIYSNKVPAVAIGVINNSGYMEMRGTSLFIAQESRLSTVRLRSAEKNGKLALVAGSDGHVSLKEVLD